MPFALDARGDTLKELILTFYSPKRILQAIRSITLNSLPAIILPIWLFCVCVCVCVCVFFFLMCKEPKQEEGSSFLILMIILA